MIIGQIRINTIICQPTDEPPPSARARRSFSLLAISDMTSSDPRMTGTPPRPMVPVTAA